MRINQWQRRWAGFTLVELLVVIGIIALLISMLLPALNRARASATSIACKAQLHSLGLVEAMYVGENRGYEFPVGYDSPPAFPLTSTGLVDVLSYYFKNQTSGNNPKNISRSVWKCPGVITEESTAQYQLTYGCNMGVHFPWTYPSGVQKYTTLQRLSHIHRQTEQVSMCDASLASGAWTTTGRLQYTETDVSEMYTASKGPLPMSTTVSGWGTNYDKGGGAYVGRWRHNGNNMMNALMLDGHVESFRFDTKELKVKNFAVVY